MSNNNLLINFAVILSGYLIGSISPAYIACRVRKGVDIRTIGDKNPGAANIKNVLGSNASFVIALLDLCKGIIPMLIAQNLKVPLFVLIITGIVTVLGHDFSVFLNFKGGKGTLTSLGVLVSLLPLETLIAFSVWFFIHFGVRKRFIGSLVTFCLIPFFTWIISVKMLGQPTSIILFPLAITGLFLFRMPENIINYFSSKRLK